MSKQLLLLVFFCFAALTAIAQVNTIKYQYNPTGTRSSKSPNFSNTTAQWIATGNIRCVKNQNNENTGNTEREERDNNSSSATYNQTRWVITGYNTTSCPLPAPASVTVALKSNFIVAMSSPIKVEFIQGSKVVKTSSFKTTTQGFAHSSIPTGSYQIRFTVPPGYNASITMNSNNRVWIKHPDSQPALITETVSFNTGTTYILTANALLL